FDWMTPAREWEPVDSLANVFNRLVLVRGDIPHSGAGGWGDRLGNGRMYPTFFFPTPPGRNPLPLPPPPARSRLPPPWMFLLTPAWLRRSGPFPHIVARNVSAPDFFAARAAQLGGMLSSVLSAIPARGHFSRNIPGYAASGLGLDWTIPEPATFFLSA